ncbi:hypothetical protein [Shimia litoralis]|nr:hypothetical protein [Shimia litoralis]
MKTFVLIVAIIVGFQVKASEGAVMPETVDSRILSWPPLQGR